MFGLDIRWVMEVREGFQEEVGRQVMGSILRGTWWWQGPGYSGRGQCSEVGQVLG